jgi:uncharacterized membrane protein
MVREINKAKNTGMKKWNGDNVFTKKVSKRLITYFLQGLILFSPIALTALSIYWAFDLIDSRLNPYLPEIGKIPGLGVIILLMGIVLLGYLGSTIIFNPIWKLLDSFLHRFPLTKFIYPAFKDIFSAVMGRDKKLNKPVLFRISKDSDLERIGFVTEEDLSSLGIGPEKVAVYVPHSYNFSGNVYIVPSVNILPLDIEAAEAMKFVVSGGMVKIKEVEDKSFTSSDNTENDKQN